MTKRKNSPLLSSKPSLEVQQTSEKDTASGEEEETGKNVTSSEIKDIFLTWSKVQGFAEKNNWDKSVSFRACTVFSDDASHHFRQILSRRQKYTS